MTKRDFFKLLVKLFGLYSLIQVIFSVLPSNISFALNHLDRISIVWILTTLLFVLGLFIALIFKSDKIIDLLKLDKGFESDDINLGNLNSFEIIKIGTLLLGGILIFDHIPGFLSQSLFALKGDIVGLEFNYRDKFQLLLGGLNIFIGYLLMSNYKFIAERLSKPDKNQK